MFKGYFYHGSMSQYIKMIVDLFSRVHIKRVSKDGIESYIKVPVIYASKEKYIRLLQEANQEAQAGDNAPFAKVAKILPAITVSLIDVDSANSHKTNTANNIRKGNVKLMNGVPYKFMFEIGVKTRYISDAHQIMEQILPYFNPNFSLNMTEIHEGDLEFNRSIQIEISSIIPDEDGTGDTGGIRRVEWPFNISFVGYIYPPVHGKTGLIKTIYMDFSGDTQVITSENTEGVDVSVHPIDVEQENWDGKTKETWRDGKRSPQERRE